MSLPGVGETVWEKVEQPSATLRLEMTGKSYLDCVHMMIQYLSTFQGRPEAEQEIDDLIRDGRKFGGARRL